MIRDPENPSLTRDEFQTSQDEHTCNSETLPPLLQQQERKKQGRQMRKNNHPSSFFSILFGDFMNKLRIPQGFINNFDGNVPTTFKLRGFNKTYWMVSVEKVGNVMFLCDGWKTFANHHGLEKGDLLVFRFDGNSEFSVEIFGNNCCVKEVHLANREQEEDKEVAENAKTKDPSFFRELRSKTNNEVAASKMKSVSRKKVRIGASDVLDSFTSTVTTYGMKSMTIPKWFVVQNGLTNIESAVILNARDEQWPVKVKERSGEKYLSWSTCSTANGVRVGCKCRFDFLKGTDNVIRVNVLETSSQGTSGSESTQHTLKRKNPVSVTGRLGAGQKKQKVLKEAKELDKNSKIHSRSLRKFTSNTKIEKTTDKMTGTSRKKIEASEVLDTFTSTVPRTGERNMVIPKWFLVQNGLANIESAVILNARGYRWPVKVQERKDGVNYLSWITFSKANGIHAGCTCRFDFLKGAENAIRVSILPTSSKDTKQVTKRKGSVFFTCSLVASGKEAKELANSSKTYFPKSRSKIINEKGIGKMTNISRKEVQIKAPKVLNSFTSKVTRSGEYIMNIPKRFVIQNGLANTKSAVILNARGDRWSVKVFRRTGGGCYLRWFSFLKANGIHAGCSCRFDLLEGA